MLVIQVHGGLVNRQGGGTDSRSGTRMDLRVIYRRAAGHEDDGGCYWKSGWLGLVISRSQAAEFDLETGKEKPVREKRSERRKMKHPHSVPNKL